MTELVDIFNTTSNQDGDSRYLNKKKILFLSIHSQNRSLLRDHLKPLFRSYSVNFFQPRGSLNKIVSVSTAGKKKDLERELERSNASKQSFNFKHNTFKKTSPRS